MTDSSQKTVNDVIVALGTSPLTDWVLDAEAERSRLRDALSSAASRIEEFLHRTPQSEGRELLEATARDARSALEASDVSSS